MSVPAVVLVTRPGAAADCLQEALRNAGAVLAWIGEPEQLDPGQPPGTVVVLNLDPAIEADLTRLSPLWSLPNVRVVFNDATVTQGLSGWDLKRWARHLVAKVFARDGHPELPDRPPGAEPLPVAPPVAEATEEETAVVMRRPGLRYVEDEISEELGAPPLPFDGAADEGRGAAGEALAEPPRATGREESAPPPAGLSFTDDLELIGDSSGGSDLPELAPELAELDVPPPAPEEDELEKLLRRAAPSAERAPPPGTSEPRRSAASAPGAPAPRVPERPSTLSLADDLPAPTPADAGQARGGKPGGVDWSRFRIEGLSLAPLEDDAAAPPSGAHASGGERRAEGTAAAEAPQPAEQLWLLVGSLGAAEAVGQFLAELRSPGRAALIVALADPTSGHASVLGNSLSGRSGLKVRVLAAGAREALTRGSVYLLPTGLRLAELARETLRTEADAAGQSLDALLKSVAASLGAGVGAIVFSGATRDGFEGLLGLAQRGAAVWAQDPSTCIAPQLPELVRSRGIATFVGSPRLLAQHFRREIG